MGKGISTQQVCLGTMRYGKGIRRHALSGLAASNGWTSIHITSKLPFSNRASSFSVLSRIAGKSPPHSPGVFASSSGGNPATFKTLALDQSWEWLRTVASVAPAVIHKLFYLSSSALFSPSVLFPPSFPLTGAMSSSYSYSTSSSELPTPRSRSLSSAASGRSSHSPISKRMSISSRRISAANPMSTINIETIAEGIKMANLDTLRGYATNNFGEVKQNSQTQYLSKNQASGYQVLREPLWNKGRSTLSWRHVVRSLLPNGVCFPTPRQPSAPFKSMDPFRGTYRMTLLSNTHIRPLRVPSASAITLIIIILSLLQPRSC